jgi:Fe-S-cluster containining protein
MVARHGVALGRINPWGDCARRGFMLVIKACSDSQGAYVANYDCSKCPGYCCSYPLIQLTKRDVGRLAKHFGLDFEAARKKFTRVDPEAKYAMRRKADKFFGKICQFFDTEKRRCTIYTARPTICREYPGGGCGYYGFLMAERNSQQDKDHVASTWNI